MSMTLLGTRTAPASMTPRKPQVVSIFTFFLTFLKPDVASKLSTKVQILTPEAAEAAAARTDDGGKSSRKQLAPGLSLLHDIAAKKVLLYSIYSLH